MYSLLEKLSLVGDSFLHYPPLSAYKKPRVSLPVTYHSPLWKKERTKQAFERRSWSQDGAASAREWWHVWQQQNVMQSKSCSILVWTTTSTRISATLLMLKRWIRHHKNTFVVVWSARQTRQKCTHTRRKALSKISFVLMLRRLKNLKVDLKFKNHSILHLTEGLVAPTNHGTQCAYQWRRSR